MSYKDSIEENQMFDYTELVGDEDPSGTWIVFGMSLIMIIALVIVIFL